MSRMNAQNLEELERTPTSAQQQITPFVVKQGDVKYGDTITNITHHNNGTQAVASRENRSVRMA